MATECKETTFNNELPQSVFDLVKLNLAKESKRFREFAFELFQAEDPISPPLLHEAGAPDWNRLQQVVNPETHGVIAYVHEPDILKLADENIPVIMFLDSTSAGGKTAVANILLNSKCGCIGMIPTIKASQEGIRDEEGALKEIQLSKKPLIVGLRGSQYVHVEPDIFQKLNRDGFFIEKPKITWAGNAWYGMAGKFFDEAINNNQQFSLCLVNRQGQETAFKWLGKKYPQVIKQKWFLLPTNMTFGDLALRIAQNRASEEVPSRIVDALIDLYDAASYSDIIIENPANPSNIPDQAVRNCLFIMNILKPHLKL